MCHSVGRLQDEARASRESRLLTRAGTPECDESSRICSTSRDSFHGRGRRRTDAFCVGGDGTFRASQRLSGSYERLSSSSRGGVVMRPARLCVIARVREAERADTDGLNKSLTRHTVTAVAAKRADARDEGRVNGERLGEGAKKMAGRSPAQCSRPNAQCPTIALCALCIVH